MPKHKNNHKELSSIEERKVNPNLCYDEKVLSLDKFSFSKQKLNLSASLQLQIAMNIFYGLMMQYLHYLRNAHDRITLLICRR